MKLMKFWPKAEFLDHRTLAPLGFPLAMHYHVYEDKRWPEQDKLMRKWLSRGGGVIKSPTGSGKTVLALAIVARMGLKTLIVFDRKDFLKQWLNELYKHTDIQEWESELGTKLAGIFEGHEMFPITFSTYQRLNTKRGLEACRKYQNYFGLIVVDEVDASAAPVMRSRISTFNPLTYLGVTATPERRDKLEGIYYDVLGPVVAESSTEQLSPTVYIHPTGFEVKSSAWRNPRMQFPMFLNQICRDKNRNKLICDQIVKDVERGRTILAISERVKHCFELQHMLTSPRQYGLASSRIAVVVGPTKNRDAIYKAVDEGKYDVLIASNVVDKGVNIPRLDTLHLLTPIASKPRVEQRIGRIRRPRKGKKKPVVRDYVDRGHGQIYGAARAREAVYERICGTVKHKGASDGSVELAEGTSLPKWQGINRKPSSPLERRQKK